MVRSGWQGGGGWCVRMDVGGFLFKIQLIMKQYEMNMFKLSALKWRLVVCVCVCDQLSVQYERSPSSELCGK